MAAVALAPLLSRTITCAWQMSLPAFSPAYTPLEGSGAQTVRGRRRGGVTAICESLSTLKLAALTPPKLTCCAP